MKDSLPEAVLVKCHEEARQGVPFNLVVTDQSVIYTRMVSFKLHPTETIKSSIADIRDVRLKRRSPFVLWILGVILLGAALTWLWSFLFDQSEWGIRPILCVLMIVFAVGCFMGGRNRFVLEWNEGKKRHRVVQPMSLNLATRDRITAALRDAARLLADPAAFQSAVAHSRAQVKVG
jgi:hypothetical protein